MEAAATPNPPAPLVLHEKAGGIIRLILNRPERFNPLSSEMIAALQKAVDAVAADPEARVVVLAAAGKGFCAGRSVQTKLEAVTGSPSRPVAGAVVQVRILSTSARASTVFQGKTAADGSCPICFTQLVEQETLNL